MRTVDLVVTGDESAAVAAAVDAVRRGQRVLVVLRSGGPRLVPRLRRLCRAAKSQLTVMTNAEVVCVDGVGGVEAVVFKKPGAFSINVFQTSNLPPLDCFVDCRWFASVFGFCQRNDTRNVTRRERHPEFSLQKLALEDPVNALR